MEYRFAAEIEELHLYNGSSLDLAWLWRKRAINANFFQTDLAKTDTFRGYGKCVFTEACLELEKADYYFLESSFENAIAHYHEASDLANVYQQVHNSKESMSPIQQIRNIHESLKADILYLQTVLDDKDDYSWEAVQRIKLLLDKQNGIIDQISEWAPPQDECTDIPLQMTGQPQPIHKNFSQFAPISVVQNLDDWKNDTCVAIHTSFMEAKHRDMMYMLGAFGMMWIMAMFLIALLWRRPFFKRHHKSTVPW